MAPTYYRAVAPGSLMLCGEHAVLHNKRAIVIAIDKKVTVTLTPRSDNIVKIQSVLGTLEIALQDITVQKPFTFILAAILYFKEVLPTGFDISVDSEFKDTLGLGSSAAVTVATVFVLQEFIASIEDKEKKSANNTRDTLRILFEIAREIIRRVQGVGSGADVAACVYGSIVVYQQNAPYILKKIDKGLPLVVIYSGFKTPTSQVIQKVENLRQQYPVILEALFEAMDKSIPDIILAIEAEDWVKLGELLRIQQGLMNAIGVGTERIDEIIEILSQDIGISGAKISGSGLGDCVIAIGKRGHLHRQFPLDVYEIPLAVDMVGVSCA